MENRLTIVVEEGPNAGARTWAARILATRAGLPFRIALLRQGEDAPGGPTLYYGRREGVRGVTILPSPFFDGEFCTKRALVEKPSGLVQQTPVLFGDGTITRREGETVISADLVASAFYFASRLEEHVKDNRDAHGRFPAAESFAGGNGLLERALVDEYARIIAGEVRRLYPSIERRRPWPERADFAACVTHDIEHLRAISRLGYLKGKTAAALRAFANGDLAGAWGAVRAGLSRAVSGHNPAWSFDALREAVRPWPASFYFFGGRTSVVDGEYDVRLGPLMAKIRELAAEGCEAGVHFGYETGDDSDSMKRQAWRVKVASGLEVRGGRHHYLSADFRGAWKAHEKAGLLYDTTLGYAEAAGFRAGTSYPFQPYDFATGKEMKIFEAPLVAMDGTFFQYQGLSAEEAVRRVMRLADAVKEAGGVFTLLWHNTMIDAVDKPQETRAYREITQALKSYAAWGATVGQAVETWRAYAQSLEEGRG